MDPNPAGTAGTVPPGPDDLMWREVADAVWLTSVTQDAWARTPASRQGTHDQDQQLTSEQPAAPGISPEEVGGHTKPADRPPGRSTTPEPSVRLGRSMPKDADDQLAGHEDRHHGGVTHDPATEELDRVRGPAAPLRLPGSMAIIRALRVFKRKVRSGHEDGVLLDEEATAEQAALDGLWLPVVKPDTERWLDLTLVVDSSLSMTLWRPQVSAFFTLLEQLGAFRTIQLRLLDTDRPAGGSPARPVLRGGTRGTPIRSPTALLDPSGRRIVLVLTDGVGQCWRQDLVSPLLAQWGTAMPVGVVHLLPQHLWERTLTPLHRALLTVPAPLSPNRRWKLELPDAWLAPDPAALVPDGAVPVPVLELESRWLGRWAQLVTGSYRNPANATVLLAGHQSGPRPTTERADEESESSADVHASAQEKVQDFLSVASPMAFRLATLLAAVPVSLPVAKIVQAELVPQSGPDHLAEVLSCGLLEPSKVTVRGDSRENTVFDFPDTVREILLSKARRSETAHVVRLITDRLDNSPLRHLPAALDAPDRTPDPVLTADTAPYVAIERAVMRSLGGPYQRRANRIYLSEQKLSSADVTSGVTVIDNNAAISGTEQVDLPSELMQRTTDTPPLVWGAVPPPNPNFIGREELLSQLSGRFADGRATPVPPVVLSGMGGIGKTQVAVEYVYRHLRDYDVIWWLEAEQPAQVRAALTELAQRLQLRGSDEANTAVPAIREALRIGVPYHRWLLVFDSAGSPESVGPFLPGNGFGNILITSRNSDWAGFSFPLKIPVFRREESKKLLKIRGPHISDKEANELADKLGDQPLAIEQAAAWRAETRLPVHEYLRLFDEKVTEIIDTVTSADYEVSIAAAWNVSFDALRTRNPSAHQLLQVCAFFAPDPIARSIFRGARVDSISPELDAIFRDPQQLRLAIRDINRYSLANINHHNDTLRLHRIVQLVLRNHMTSQLRAKIQHAAHLLLANRDPDDPVSSRQWPWYQSVLPHAYAAQVIESDDLWVRQLVINLMEFLYHWGDHEEACSLAHEAVKKWTTRLGFADPQTLQAASKLGFYLWTLGRYPEAAQINERTVERHRASGENSEVTLIAELAVANDLKGSGDFIAALNLNRRVYEKARKLFRDDNDVTTLMTAHDLVVSLGLAGEYRKGNELAEDTYRRRVNMLGYDNPHTTSTLNALILDRREMGDYSFAVVEQERLAERSARLFGVDKANTLRRFYHLAVARRKNGDYPGALKLSTDVEKSFNLRYGENHPNAMASTLGHSIDLRNSSRIQDARELCERTVELYRQSLGNHHPHTLSALLDLAVILRLLGNVVDARQLDELTFEQFQLKLGSDHPHSVVSSINMASDFAALRQPDEALALGTEALGRASRVLGPDHPTTLAASANLVLDLRTLDRSKEAETRYVNIMARYRRVLGNDHPLTRNAASGIRVDCDIDPLPL